MFNVIALLMVFLVLLALIVFTCFIVDNWAIASFIVLLSAVMGNIFWLLVQALV